MIRIAFLGECMIEHSDENPEFRFGGDTLNTALYLSRLTKDKDISIYYATGLGEDADSDRLTQAWQSEGIQTDLVKVIGDKKPGHYWIENSADGERSFTFDRDDSAARYYFSEETSPLAEALENEGLDYIYLSGICLAIVNEADFQKLLTLLKYSKDKGTKVIFDNNYRPTLWTQASAADRYNQVLALTDIALLTNDDEQAVHGTLVAEDIAARTRGLGVGEIVVKQGAKSCCVYEQYKVTELAPTPVNNVVDTCAAGDSFGAGYLAKRLFGEEIQASIANGHKVAGFVIQHKGAIVPIDLWNERFGV